MDLIAQRGLPVRPQSNREAPAVQPLNNKAAKIQSEETKDPRSERSESQLEGPRRESLLSNRLLLASTAWDRR